MQTGIDKMQNYRSLFAFCLYIFIGFRCYNHGILESILEKEWVEFMRKNTLKKGISILVLAALASGLPAGCGSRSAGTAKAPGNTGEHTAAADGGTLTYWLDLNPNVSANFVNLGDTEMAKALQERTGIAIEFQHPASGQSKEQFNLMIADGNLPDIMEYQWVKSYPGGPEKAIRDGVILPLNDIFEKYCPNITKYLAENPDIDRMIKTDEGNYFAFPFIRGDEGLCYTVGGFIRKDWLDELGLAVPTTIDEWHTVLTSFKNEKGAEAPLCFDWTNFKISNPFAFTYGVGGYFILDDAGNVQYGPALEGYKEYLQTLNKWYAEGLFDRDVATLNGDQVTSKMTSGKAGASVGWAASRMQVFMTTAQKTSPEYLLVPTPVPVRNKGDKPEYGYIENQFPDVGAAITTSCKNIEAAAKLLDYGYSEEGFLLYNFGIEGVSYTMEDGKAAYTDLIFNNPDGWPLAQSMSKYIRANYNGPFVQSINYLEQYLQLPTVKECPSVWEVEGAGEHVVPNVTPTQDEAKEMAAISNELGTYVDEMSLKFIFGTESFDNWDKYIRTLEDMNLTRALEIQNMALERYKAR